MRIWINTKCDNSEGNECVCPKCRWIRKSHGRQLTLEEIEQMNEDFKRWVTRHEGMERIMKSRFPEDK